MLKKLLLTTGWLFFASALLVATASLYSHFYLNPGNWLTLEQKASVASGRRLSTDQALAAQVESTDARAQLVANFLERHNSPMQPYDHYGRVIVEIADRYGIDFRLLPAIAMQESNLCRVTNPSAPRNCLGFGIHKSGTLDFDSYEAGFERAGRELKTFYIDKGLTTVEAIESKYTPSSNGSWANSVNQWMAEMRYDDRQLGRENKDDADASEFARERVLSPTPSPGSETTLLP